MRFLGINAIFHDPAAALVADGRIVAAAEEERFSRRKHGKRPLAFSAWELPELAAAWCLSEAGLSPEDIDAVAYSYDPSLVVQRPEGDWEDLRTRYAVRAPAFLATALPGLDPGQVSYVPHHVAHAASAGLASPWRDCAVLVCDGRGENVSHLAGRYRGGELEILATQELPHSLGLMYEDVTQHLGFLRSSDEYKVMAMASYGRPPPPGGAARGDLHDRRRRVPRRAGRLERLRQSAQEGHSLDLRPRRPGRQRAGPAGGGAAGAGALAARADRGAAAGAGGRGGAQLRGQHPAAGRGAVRRGVGAAGGRRLGHRAGRGAAPGAGLRRTGRAHELPGPGARLHRRGAGGAWLDVARVPYTRPADLGAAVAAELAADRIVAWFQGRSEYGPRALGHRSLLAHPGDPRNTERLNDVKGREQFRPVAPMVLETRAREIFGRGPVPSPYMLFVHDVHPDWAARIPAVVHVDGTARIQTVSPERQPLMARVLSEFEARTGLPVVVNTSLNTAGRPMVDDPRDALECFGSAPVDVLALGPYLVRRGEVFG
ncbi:hypothetical protein GCM10020001_007090 [Nonomuraea salmonea]